MGLWDTLQLDMDRHRLLALVGGGGKTTSIYALAAEARLRGKTVVVTTTTRMLPHPALFLAAADEGANLKALLDRYGAVAVGTLTGEGRLTGAADLSVCKAAADIVLVEADGARMRPLKAPADHEPVIPPQADAVIALCGLDCLGGRIAAVCHRSERVAALLDKPLDARITPADAAKILLSDRGSRKNVDGRPFCCILNKADTPERLAAGEEMKLLLARAGVPAAVTAYSEEAQEGGSFPLCER